MGRRFHPQLNRKLSIFGQCIKVQDCSIYQNSICLSLFNPPLWPCCEPWCCDFRSWWLLERFGNLQWLSGSDLDAAAYEFWCDCVRWFTTFFLGDLLGLEKTGSITKVDPFSRYFELSHWDRPCTEKHVNINITVFHDYILRNLGGKHTTKDR